MPTSRALLPITSAALVAAAALAWHAAGPAGRTRPTEVVTGGGDPWTPTFESSRRRQDAKLAIVREVIAGRRRLPEAAALFGELNRLPPAVRDMPPDLDADPTIAIPKNTTTGRLCRQVVFWARAVARSETPGRAAAVVARLEAEYRDAQDERGDVPLPDPASLEPVSELLDRGRVTAAR